MDYQSYSTFANNWAQTDYVDPNFFSEISYDIDLNNDIVLPTWEESICDLLSTPNALSQTTPNSASAFSDQSDEYFDFNSKTHILLPEIEVAAVHHRTKHSTSSDSQSPLPMDAPKRKRGRPTANYRRESSNSISSSHTTSPKPSNRTPHNQVERKYREGLNSEMERLRLVIPETGQFGSSQAGKPPSKATVLASAIEYIQKIERERDCLLKENALLRQ